MPLLQTKLFIPPNRPVDIIERPHLSTLLDQTLYQKLTLVSAPAGFGKTTLVASWLAALRANGLSTDRERYRQSPEQSSTDVVHYTWLSLDENDNELVRFLSYFVAAIQKAAPSVGEAAWSILQAPAPIQPDLLLTSLINEIVLLSQQIVLVLDDYHVIHEATIHKAVDFWLEHAPPNAHLIITTRIDPNLPLSLLRGRGQMNEIRVDQLRFTTEEIRQFLDTVMQIELTQENVDALEQRTEGWIAGLKMAGLSMRGQTDMATFINNFTGSHRYIIDYLAEQVLDQCRSEIQHFLLRTSFLGRMCAPLCEAIMVGEKGTHQAQAILEELEGTNLFVIPLDEERRWYRYHHLFAEFLHKRFIDQNSNQAFLLHRHASHWFEGAGLLNEAVDHAAKAQDHQRLLQIIEQHGEAITSQGELTTMLRWFALIPPDLAHTNPHVCLFQSIALMYSGRVEEAQELLKIIRETYQAPQLPDLVAGRLASMQAVIHVLRRQFETGMHFCREALEILPATDLNGRSTTLLHQGNIYLEWKETDAAIAALKEAIALGRLQPKSTIYMVAAAMLASLLINQGKLREAEVLCRSVIADAIERYGHQPVPLSAVAYIVLGRVLYEWNRLEEAETYLLDGIRLLEITQNVGLLSSGYMLMARVKLATQGLEAAFSELAQAEERIRRSELSHLLEEITLARCWLHWYQGDLDAATQQLNRADKSNVRHMDVPLMELRLTMAQRPYDAQQVLDALEAFWSAEDQEHSQRILFESKLIAVQAHALNNNTKQAEALLCEVIQQSKPEGYMRLFLDEGERLGPLLQRSASAFANDTQRFRELLAAFSSRAATASSAPMGNSDLVEPLSERELEVLSLLAEGCTNAQIAERLIITVGTTKRHVSNIYGKLGVGSRTQAVAYAQEIGLL